jgi:hypothetical protein
MPIVESRSAPLSHWPSVEELRTLAADGALVLLPDRVSLVGNETVAAFREDAQALRVRGREAGLRVELSAPAGARLGVYREHAAEWILPVAVFLGAQAANVISNLIANEIQRRLDAWRGTHTGRAPAVRYRELLLQGDDVHVREVEGSAEEIVALLRAVPTQIPVARDEVE